jgi:hypothetical protein
MSEVRMNKYFAAFATMIALLCFAGSITFGGGQPGYLTPAEIKTEAEKIANANKDLAKLHTLGKSPGGGDILLLELGKKASEAPAIMVVANMEGNYPIAGEAALELSRLLVGDWKAELDSRRWYIMPLANPDGYANFFSTPLDNSYVNDRPVNKDNDDATDEDGPDDLNGDGYITMMRQAHPEGKWIKIENHTVLMKKAESEKGEEGEYRLFSEGVDNDGDGEINEDGPGGANPGNNFPHDFQHHTKTDGLWAASEPETRAVLEFAFAHPEIAMLTTFGQANTLKDVPEATKKSAAIQDSYKLPEWMSKQMGVDPEKKFTMEELLEMGRAFTGYQDLTEEMVLQFLGVGAAVNPDKKDLPYWNEISERYNDFIKEAGLDAERLKPKGFPSGSLEEWGYFQYGVATFAMDFWTLPEPKKEEKEEKEEGALTPDELEKMTNEEFIALGNEKIAAFLKASGAPAQYTADMVIMGLQGGMMDTKKMAEMIRKMKKKDEAGGADETEEALYAYNPDAFVAWQAYDHPTLGAVEIGGMIPYSTLAPPIDSARELVAKQLPFIRTLAGLLPQIAIEKTVVEKKSPGVWKVETWVVNNGFLPYPSHQGKRCQRPAPAAATLTGKSATFLEGRERQVLGLLGGSGGTQKVHWLIRADEGSAVTITVHSFSAGSDEKVVTLKGGGK